MRVLLLSNEKEKEGKERWRETIGNIRTHVTFGCQSEELIADDSQTIRHEPHVLNMIKA